MRARQEDVRGLFLSVMRLVALVGCPVCVILSASATPFVQTVLGHKWLAMIPALAVLGIWGAVLQVEATIGWFLNSVGEVRVNGRIAWAVLVPLVPAAILAADFGSITTVSWVMTVSLVVTCIATVGAAARRAGLRVRDQWLALKPVLIASPVAWAAARAVESVSAGGISAPLSLLLSATAGLLAYLAVATLVEPGLLRQAARQLRRVVSRAPAVASAPAAPDPVAHTDFARPGAREMIDS
jgi:O-antigen/teichoic acid export membrane protein